MADIPENSASDKAKQVEQEREYAAADLERRARTSQYLSGLSEQLYRRREGLPADPAEDSRPPAS